MTRDVTVELKALRLHGMAGAWADLVEQGTNAGVDSSRWLIEHLLQAEGTDRAMRSVSHQMHAAKFPVHRDIAGFDISQNPGITATLYNVGNPEARAYALKAENDQRVSEGKQPRLPEENYYGWLVNEKLPELQALF